VPTLDSAEVGWRALSGRDKRVGKFPRPVYHHVVAAGDADELVGVNNGGRQSVA